MEIGDMRDRHRLRRAVHSSDQIFNFAAQVAVMTSLVDPISDFEINARGTLNLLEEIRLLGERPPVLFTSTN
jgi:CDP-paratose 2-epimerase